MVPDLSGSTTKKIFLFKLRWKKDFCDKTFSYRLFHKTLPRSSALISWISVRFYETDCIKNMLLINFQSIFFYLCFKGCSINWNPKQNVIAFRQQLVEWGLNPFPNLRSILLLNLNFISILGCNKKIKKICYSLSFMLNSRER